MLTYMAAKLGLYILEIRTESRQMRWNLWRKWQAILIWNVNRI